MTYTPIATVLRKRPFWVWRVQQFAKVGEVELPWPYNVLDLDGRLTTMQGVIRSLEPDARIPEALIAFVTDNDSPRNALWSDSHGGTGYSNRFTAHSSMDWVVDAVAVPCAAMWMVRVSRIPSYNRGRREAKSNRRGEFVVTPPIYMFFDGGEADGSSRYWVQPEVFEATGQIMQGANPKEWSETRHYADDTQFDRDVRSVPAEVTIALDSFLEHQRVDPRFGGAPTRTSKPRKR